MPFRRSGLGPAARRRYPSRPVRGEKTATASLVEEYAIDGEPLPVVGERYPVAGDDGMILCVVETVAADVVPLCEVSWAFACAEGEGFTSVADWRARHEAVWRDSAVPGIRQHLSDSAWDLTDDTLVVMEWFRVVERVGSEEPA
jgi:uncharacterized protein YhfF